MAAFFLAAGTHGLPLTLIELEECIREFRRIFKTDNMPYLYLYIDTYAKSTIKELSSFANGLSNNIAAVENAVASPLSNAYVEGTNNKIKMKKRVMYGRYGIELLSAKLMLKPK